MKTLHFRAYPQQGQGLGGIFRALSRFIFPMAKTLVKAGKPLARKAIKYVGKQVAQTGLDTVKDVVEGKNVKQALKENVKKTGSRIWSQAKDKVRTDGSRMLSDALKGAGRGKKRQKAFKSTRRKKVKKRKTIFD